MKDTRKHNQVFTNVGPVEMAPLASLKPPGSLRLYKSKHIQIAARFLERLGVQHPLLVTSDGTVLAGAIWYLAALKLELIEVPVVRATNLSKGEIDAYRIGVEQIPQLAEYDRSALGMLFTELSNDDFDFSLELTGFSATEIDLLIEDALVVPASEDDSADQQPSLDLGPAVTKLGDTWQLGHHRIHCGSALDSGAWTALMGEKKATMVFADPPYNVPVDGHVSGKGAIKHREFAMGSGEMTADQFTAFLKTTFGHLVAHSSDGSIHYLCMDWRHADHLLAAGNDLYTRLLNLCVWVKRNGGMGSFYRSRHELVFVYKNGSGCHRNNIELGRHGRNRTNVWEYAGANSFSGRNTDEGNLLTLHPTTKPVQLIADAILDCTDHKDIIVDPFLGSGSTLIAAERMNRLLYGMELDPLYVDTAIRRWQQHTGRNAVHAITGRSFDELASQEIA